jgi:ABC-2 type transport system permease protein
VAAVVALGEPTFEYAHEVPFAGRLRSQLAELVRYRHLVWHLLRSTSKLESRGTRLGLVWWVLDPLLLMAVYYVLVGVILRRNIANYPLFVLLPILAWEFFTRATQGSMALTLSSNQSMRSLAFPRSVIPLAVTLAEGARFLVAVVAFVLCAIPFGVHPNAAAVFAIPFVLLVFVFVLGLSYLLAALYVFFRDTKHLCEYVFWLWFHLSPGIYSLEMIPERYRTIFRVNPITALFEGLRDSLFYGRTPSMPAAQLGGVIAIAVILLVGGYLYFVGSERSFAKVD